MKHLTFRPSRIAGAENSHLCDPIGQSRFICDCRRTGTAHGKYAGALSAIRLAEANSDLNCTGWVLLAPHSWIQCRDVQHILDDNGYQVVAEARPGDLVVYRDDAGIVHVGCVASVVESSLPSIESKWGYQGLFLHSPEGTPYGDAWSYYRSKRSDHLLHTASCVKHVNGNAAAEILP